MALVAIALPKNGFENSERFSIFRQDKLDLRNKKLNFSFKCAACGGRMRLVSVNESNVIRPHFRHHTYDKYCDLLSKAVGNQILHEDCKMAVAFVLQESAIGFEGCDVQFEVRVENESDMYTGKTHQRIDVACYMPDGRKFAHEIQLSRQEVSDFEERTEIYKASGFETVWWLGGACATDTNKEWCMQKSNLGGVFEFCKGDRVIGSATYRDLQGVLGYEGDESE